MNFMKTKVILKSECVEVKERKFPEEWTLEIGEPEIEVSPEAVEELTKILSNPTQKGIYDEEKY